jgi:tetratricopeptide (TPR) repeat protein
MDLFFKLNTTIKSGAIGFNEKLWMKGFSVLLLLLFFSQAFAQDVLMQQKADRLFKTGTELMIQKQYAAARENFTEYLALATTPSAQRQDAQYYRGICSLNLYHTDSEKQLQDFIESNPSSPKASVAYADLANFFYQEKNYKKSASYFSKTDFNALTSSQQSEAHFRWGYCLFSQKFLKDALDQFNYVKTQGGQYGPASSYYAGFAEYNQGDYANALTDLKRAEATESYAPIVPYLIANVYYKQKDYNTLITYAGSVASREGLENGADLALLTAEAYYKKADYKNALAGYDKYLEGKEATASKSVLLRAGYSAYLLGQDNKALNYLKSSFADADSVGFYSSYYLGQLYLKANQRPMALTAFDIARKYKADPKLVEESSFLFAKIAYEMGRSDQAIGEFEKIAKVFPSSSHIVEIKELLSQAYVNANNYNKAIEYIESLPTRSPSVERAYQKATMLKGMEYFNQEDYTQAVTYFEKSLEHPADQDYSAEANFWCGESYSIMKKYDKASANYLHAIDGDDAALKIRARYGLGYAYYNLQQYDRALFSFKEFVLKSPASQPNLADGAMRLADCYYVSKSYSDALVYYRKAIALKSSDSDYGHFQSGIISGILQKYPEAKTELSRVIRDYPMSSYVDEARFQLAQQEFEQGHYDEAVTGYSGLIASNPSSRFTPYAYVRRAASYYNLKDYNKTAQDYIFVIENYGSHPAAKDILLPLQEALNLAGRSAEFNQNLAKYSKANPSDKGLEMIEFEAAKNLYFNQDYANAIKNLDAFISSYKQSAKLSEAKYYQAEAYYRLKDFGKALPIYNELSQDKTFAMANKVNARVAELEFKQTHYDKAAASYQVLAKEATNKKEQYNAWNGLMESYFFLAKYDSVEKFAKLILEKGAITAGAQNKASLFLGKAAIGKGDYETAKDELLSTINAAQDEYGAEAKYRLAEIFFATKEYKQCYETLVSLNTDFSAYPNWVGKGFLLMSDNSLATNDSFQAKATLQSLIDNFPDGEIKNQAIEKLKKINDDEVKKQNQVKADTLDKKN